MGALCSLDEDSTIADTWGCQYLIAEWGDAEVDGCADSASGCSKRPTVSWPIELRPGNRDPVVRAHWMDCEFALAHPQLSRDRRELLCKAAKFRRCWSWLRDMPSLPKEQS